MNGVSPLNRDGRVAEERNAKTAITYSDLGLAKYAAIEGFKRYK